MGCCVTSNNQTLGSDNSDCEKPHEEKPKNRINMVVSELADLSDDESITNEQGQKRPSFWEPSPEEYAIGTGYASGEDPRHSFWTCRSEEDYLSVNNTISPLNKETSIYLSMKNRPNGMLEESKQGMGVEDEQAMFSLVLDTRGEGVAGVNDSGPVSQGDVDVDIDNSQEIGHIGINKHMDINKHAQEISVNIETTQKIRRSTKKRSGSAGDEQKENRLSVRGSRRVLGRNSKEGRISRKSKNMEGNEESKVPEYDFAFPSNLIFKTEKVELTRDYIKRKLEMLDMETAGWKSSIDTEHIKLSTRYDKEFGLPIGKIVYYFDGNKFSYEDIMDIIFNPKTRKSWDNGILEFEIVEDLSPIMQVYYMALKFPFPFKNRDFLEKRVKLIEGGKVYIFYSAIPLGIYPKYNKKGRVRGTSHFGGCIFSKEGDKIRYFAMCITDTKIKALPKWMIKSFIPSTTRNSYAKIQAALNAKYEKATKSFPDFHTTKL